MKQRTVIFLWILAITLGIAAYFVKFHTKNENLIHTHLSPGEKFLPDLPIRDLTTVTLHQGKDTTTLTRGANNRWTIKERANYPANHELLRNLLGALSQVRITQGYPCSDRHYGRFGVSAESNDESDLGLKISMFKDESSPFAQVFLGKYNGSSRNTMGRFIRLASDPSGVYAVGETFPGVYADPPAWLDKSFLHIQNIQSIELTAPENPDFESWKLTRKNPAPQTQFKLYDLSEQEFMKLTSTSALRVLFSVTSFQDVLSAEKAKQAVNPDPKLKRQVKIHTFDGITYTINYRPESPAPQTTPDDPESPLPPVKAGYQLTVQISANLPDTRNKQADESPEEAKKKDDAFLARQKELKETVDLVKSFQERIFRVGHTMIDPLNKSRSDFVSKKTSPKKSKNTPTPQAPQATKTP